MSNDTVGLTNSTPKKVLTRNRDWKKKFLEALKNTANVRAACYAAGIDRVTAYTYRKKDEKFAKEWETSLDEAVDLLEASAWQRAKSGITREHSHFYKGNLVGKDVIQEYSDTLLIFLLKAHRPEKYRERYTIDFNIKNELQKKMNEFGLTEEQIRRSPALAPIFVRAGVISDSSLGNGAVGET